MRNVKIQIETLGSPKILLKYLENAFDATIYRDEFRRSKFISALLQTILFPLGVRQDYFSRMVLVPVVCCIPQQKTIRNDAGNSGF